MLAKRPRNDGQENTYVSPLSVSCKSANASVLSPQRHDIKRRKSRRMCRNDEVMTPSHRLPGTALGLDDALLSDLDATDADLDLDLDPDWEKDLGLQGDDLCYASCCDRAHVRPFSLPQHDPAIKERRSDDDFEAKMEEAFKMAEQLVKGIDPGIIEMEAPPATSADATSGLPNISFGTGRNVLKAQHRTTNGINAMQPQQHKWQQGIVEQWDLLNRPDQQSANFTAAPGETGVQLPCRRTSLASMPTKHRLICCLFEQLDEMLRTQQVALRTANSMIAST